MSWIAAVAVGSGAALGAWLRWGLSLWLNPLFLPLPLGTLVANLVGGLLMGVLMGAGELLPLPPQWRLFAGTGFLGGLTTFSTFSGEAAALIERGDYFWGGALVCAHVVGSVAATLLGLWLVRAMLRG